MGMGVKHYFKDGKEHKGSMHKHPDGTLMTGKSMSNASKNCSTMASSLVKPKLKLNQGGVNNDYVRNYSV